jgi:hypothetical protein
MENEDIIRYALEAVFPQLRQTGYRITSPADRVYNCIAWAAGRTHQWWWPIGRIDPDDYWPPGVPEEETISAFVQAFHTLGYGEAPNDELREGIEKVALYARNDKPTHAARQLGSGLWTSKLGNAVDIEHTLAGLVGDKYGQVVKILQRVIVTPSAS